MNCKVILVTILPVKPGLEDLLLDDLAPIIEATRLTQGCLAFDLYRVVKSPEALVLQETWETKEDQAAYSHSRLATELSAVWAKYLKRPGEDLGSGGIGECRVKGC